MILNKRIRLVLYLLGILAFIFVTCNSSTRKIKDKEEVYTSEEEVEIEEETATIDVSETTETSNLSGKYKPTIITSQQFINLVADYRKEWNNKGVRPCVVDFYADWCRPCKMMEPTFEKMAEKYAGKIDFYKVNVDYNLDISNAYQISGIPTLFFCSLDGKLIRVMGYQTEEQIKENLEMIM